MTIYMVISAVLCLIFIGVLGLIAFYVMNIIFTLIASIKANEGVDYRYPMTIRLIK